MSRFQDSNSIHYPAFHAQGPAREIGRQHGEQAQLKIKAFLLWLCESLGVDESELAHRARRFEPLFKTHCPHLLEEVRGLAEGAGIKRGLALACQLRGELGQTPPDGCTTFVVGRDGTADGNVLIGQTSDMPAEMREFCYVLHLQPDDRPELIMWTFGGMIGYHGLNEHGVAHFANSLGGGPAWQFALSHYPVKRLILEQPDLASVRGLLSRVPVSSNGNYVLCDGQGNILDVELTSQGPLTIEDAGDGFLAHSNHFLCAPHNCQANFDISLPDSFPRLDRIRRLIAAKFGTLTPEDMQSILADHEAHPVSICRHPHDGHGDDILPASGRTVAAMVAEPNRGRFHLCCGNPCEQPFVEFRLSTAQ